MANITTRQDFISNCLRRLGQPVLTVNLDEDSIDDAVTEALELFWREHQYGSREIFFKKTVLAGEVDSSELLIPKETGIDTVVRILPSGGYISSAEWHTVPWQTAYAAVAGLEGYLAVSASDFMLLRQRLKTLRSQFQQPLTFKFDPHSRMLRLERACVAGDIFVMKCYQNVDPESTEFDFTDAWNDRWLQKYATALIKERWANVLVNLQGVKLPGTLVIDGQSMYQAARTEIEQLETELRTVHRRPVTMRIG